MIHCAYSAGTTGPRAVAANASHRLEAALLPQKTYRLAAQGSVWGSYPLAPPAKLPVARRHNPLRSARGVAKRAARLLASADISIEQARWSLACAGIGEESTALALACVARRYEQTLGLTARPNQLQAAAELLNQKLVELATGQGKSLAAAMAAAVAALAGASVHVLTANTYLARRDCDAHQAFFTALGLTVASATDECSPDHRRDAFENDICYTTARTVAFDFLRDQRKAQSAFGLSPAQKQAQPVLRGLCFAIVDEADSLLIDEASMPLVLSEKSAAQGIEIDLAQCLQQAAQLVQGIDFEPDPSSGKPRLLPAGTSRLNGFVKANTGINQRHRQEMLQQALTALHFFKKGRHYIVQNKDVLLIDANTGRVAPGRALSGHLHALVCILEGVEPPTNGSNQTGLTYPRFFSRYHHLCGLSGTLRETRAELRQAYGLKIKTIRSHQRCRLIRYPDRTFDDQRQQFTAAIGRASRLAKAGRAVLIGTDCVSDARRLARGFARAGVGAALLDAANETFEARRISRAGRTGQITISTQIAGRGTDIEIDETTRQAGGLHVLNLQHNRSGRIDRQMAGRAARQSDPGSWEHWLVLRGLPFEPRPPQAVARRLQRPAGLLMRVGLSRPLLRLMQHLWQWQDRSQRYARLRADIHSAQSLQISTMKHL